MKITPAMAAIIHVGESAASSAVLTLIVGIVQQLATHQVNAAELGTIFGSGFVACFGLVYKSVKADPALPQAESDTANEAKSLAQRALDHIEHMWPILNAHNSVLASQKPATPAPLSGGGIVAQQPSIASVTPVSVPQLSFAGTQAMPTATTVYTGTINLPTSLPPRSWSDTALTQAITPQPPRG